jgi:ubiquinone/menaquinone biosynthesis C-methylase UbiE
MELEVAVRLIEKGVAKNAARQAWADLGAGHGLFTKALATLLMPDCIIYAVDKVSDSLNAISLDGVKKIHKDFITEEIGLGPLDGVLMANSLHFIADKSAFLSSLKKNFKRSGRLILVEYDTDTANSWVPYPISYSAARRLAGDAGFSVTKLGEEPSLYNRANLYSCLWTPV